MGKSSKGRAGGFTFKSPLTEIKIAFSQVGNKVDKAIEETLNELMKEAYELSQTYVPDSNGPHRTYSPPPNMGALKASGQWDAVIKSGRKYITKLHYGDDVADYALFVHENMPSAVPMKNYSTDGTGARFLARAIETVFTKEAVIAMLRTKLR